MSDLPEPAAYAVDGGVHTLTGQALSALLKDVLARDVPFRFEAHGYSMLPFIRGGDLVTVSPLRGRRARFGEVVAFANPAAGLIVHRVTTRRHDMYEIRADNSHGPGDVVSAARIFGAVTRVERDGRPVRLGLGPERVLVGGLSRAGLLQPLVAVLRTARGRFAEQRVP